MTIILPTRSIALMSSDSVDVLVSEAQDLLYRMIHYAGCIIDNITAFTSPNTSSVPDIAHPGAQTPNEFIFRHPPLHSHDVQKVFDYRRQEIAVLKAIIDDLLEQKDLYRTTYTALTSRLEQLDSLLSRGPISTSAIRASSHDLSIESLTVSTVASLDQSTVQLYLADAGVQPATAFSTPEEYKQYLTQMKNEKLSHIKQQNRLLLTIVDKCVRLRGALIASREARNAV